MAGLGGRGASATRRQADVGALAKTAAGPQRYRGLASSRLARQSGPNRPRPARDHRNGSVRLHLDLAVLDLRQFLLGFLSAHPGRKRQAHQRHGEGSFHHSFLTLCRVRRS